MVSNDFGSIFVGWWMSIAIQPAKEHQNPSPHELVMVKTANQSRLKPGGAVVPLEQAVLALLERPGVSVLAGRSIRC